MTFKDQRDNCEHDFSGSRHFGSFTIGDEMSVHEHVSMGGAYESCVKCGAQRLTRCAQDRLEQLEAELQRELQRKPQSPTVSKLQRFKEFVRSLFRS